MYLPVAVFVGVANLQYYRVIFFVGKHKLFGLRHCLKLVVDSAPN